MAGHYGLFRNTEDFHAYMDESHSGVLHAIAESGKLEADTAEHLTGAIEDFIKTRR